MKSFLTTAATVWRRVLPIVLLLLAASAWARIGFVETRDGRTFEGQIRLESNVVVIANGERGYVARVEGSNVAEVSFRSSPDRSTSVVEPRPAGTDAPAGPWRSADVGDVERRGGVTTGGGVFRVWSSGTDIGGERDGFHFVFKSWSGDGEIVARVLGAGLTDPGTKAGLMMREAVKGTPAITHLTNGSRNVFFGVTPRRGGVWQWREDDRGGTTNVAVAGLAAPCWLQLKREGNAFTAYSSRNGAQWTLVEKSVVPMAEEICVGMAVTSVNGYRLNQGVFDHVREGAWIEGAFVPRVELVNGSVAVGRLSSVDETAVRFAGLQCKPAISTLNVGRILFQWVPERWAGLLKPGRPGVLLTDGTFVEGEFRRMERGRVEISSVLHGVKQFDLGSEVMAVVLRKVTPKPAEFTVMTMDGSVYAVSEAVIGQNEIVVREASLGRWQVPIYEVREVRREVRSTGRRG